MKLPQGTILYDATWLPDFKTELSGAQGPSMRVQHTLMIGNSPAQGLAFSVLLQAFLRNHVPVINWFLALFLVITNGVPSCSKPPCHEASTPDLVSCGHLFLHS